MCVCERERALWDYHIVDRERVCVCEREIFIGDYDIVELLNSQCPSTYVNYKVTIKRIWDMYPPPQEDTC